MKVKVLKKFIDRQEKAVRQPGEVFECTPERYDEIMSKNRLIEPFEKTEQKKESEAEQVQKEKEPDQSEVDEEKPVEVKRTTKKK